MFTIKETTALMGVSELRTKTAELLKTLKDHRVILTKRNQPVGVVIDYAEYAQMERILEEVEDFVLGTIAKARSERNGKKVITLEEAERRVGLR